MRIVAGVPVKSFSAAKHRLAVAIPPEARIAVSREMARRTCELLTQAGARPLVLAADVNVASWAKELGLEVVLDQGSDLNRAATAIVESAAGGPWMVCHADLPFLDADILSVLVAALAGSGSVIAPSRDGGTPVLGSSLSSFSFAYGPGSFHRHLARLATTPTVVIADPRVAIDLDEPSDLEAARTRVPWITRLLDSLDQS